ncbi:hypothetical protein GJV80_09340 [Microlunatus sp. Gsoil 973]|nr:hypothetical protein GJV80_09340 [Microlunatus sp. Gsoil 973]
MPEKRAAATSSTGDRGGDQIFTGGRTSELPAGRRSADPRRFVVDLQRNLPQLVGMLLAMVSTEQKLGTTRHGDAYVGLRAATVAPVRRRQGCVVDD